MVADVLVAAATGRKLWLPAVEEQQGPMAANHIGASRERTDGRHGQSKAKSARRPGAIWRTGGHWCAIWAGATCRVGGEVTALTRMPSQILIVPAGEELVEDPLFSTDPLRRCSRRNFFSGCHGNRQVMIFAEAHADGAFAFGIKEDQLTTLTRDHKYSTLQQYQGISGLANMLKTGTEKGIRGVDSNIDTRKMPLGRTHTPVKRLLGNGDAMSDLRQMFFHDQHEQVITTSARGRRCSLKYRTLKQHFHSLKNCEESEEPYTFCLCTR